MGQFNIQKAVEIINEILAEADFGAKNIIDYAYEKSKDDNIFVPCGCMTLN